MSSGLADLRASDPNREDLARMHHCPIIHETLASSEFLAGWSQS